MIQAAAGMESHYVQQHRDIASCKYRLPWLLVCALDAKAAKLLFQKHSAQCGVAKRSSFALRHSVQQHSSLRETSSSSSAVKKLRRNLVNINPGASGTS